MLGINGTCRLCAKICMNYSAQPLHIHSPGPRGDCGEKEQAVFVVLVLALATHSRLILINLDLK